MTATTPARWVVPVPWRRWAAAGLAGMLLAVIVGHGCHGPDQDLEPAIPPAVDTGTFDEP